MTSDREMLSGVALQLLDQGFVRVVDTMGDDCAVLQAINLAPRRNNMTLDQQEVDTINDLMRLGYDMRPFKACVLQLHLKLPMYLVSDFLNVSGLTIGALKHTDDDYAVDPDILGVDPTAVVAIGNLSDSLHGVSRQAIAFGVKKGLSEDVTQVYKLASAYVEVYVTGDLFTFMQFIGLYMSKRAGYEISEYAGIFARILQAWVPTSFEAFMQHRFHAETFSVKEQELLAPFMSAMVVAMQATDGGMATPAEGFTVAEWAEFNRKLASVAKLAS